MEEEYAHKTKYTAGKASYVERNKAMTDDSDICILYYKEGYLPQRRKRSIKDLGDYQPKSGTSLAYQYIKSKGKRYINVVEN